MPPFLATLAGKAIGAVALLLLAFAFGLYEGCALKQQAWDAAMAQQAAAAASTMVKQGENTAKIVTKYIRVRDESAAVAEARAAALQKELDAYVQDHPPCPVPESVVRLFDQPAADPLPAPASSAGGTDAAREAVTLAGVLSALADYRAEYDAVAGRYNALIEWVRSSTDVQRGEQPSTP